MTINPAAASNDAYDLLDGSVSAFYAAVDEAIVASEVVKGQYRMTINPAYNAPNPVDSNSFTTIGLSQSGPMVVDLENSYITTVVHLNLTLDQQFIANAGNRQDNCYGALFVGWKSSIEAIERYDIMVNSTPIYTQSFCGEESFLQYQVVNDLVKHTSPHIYSCYDDVINMSPNVCGTYLWFNMTGAAVPAAGDLDDIQIPIKIPISNFLILKNLKYLLSWMGKWEIRLYFSPQNLVVLPIPSENITLFTNVTNASQGVMSHNFHQIGEKFLWLNSAGCHAQAPAAAPAAPHQTLNRYPDTCYWQLGCTKMTLHDVSMNTAQFQLRMDILEMLKQKYLMEKPLTFPVSTVQIARFTGCPEQTPDENNKSVAINIVLCQAINNCDTLFILPFRDATQHTTCTNPHCTELQLHAGEYGSYPTQPFNTYAIYGKDNVRFINSVADALNVNASEMMSFSKDVSNSFCTHILFNPNRPHPDYLTPLYYKDATNFFIPFPFSTDNDFQGGLSSPSSNINFKITGNLNYHDVTDSRHGKWVITDDRKFDSPWVAAFLIDGVIMIRPDPGSDAAKVIWSDRTVC